MLFFCPKKKNKGNTLSHYFDTRKHLPPILTSVDDEYHTNEILGCRTFFVVENECISWCLTYRYICWPCREIPKISQS